jgi:nitrite reductase/ring-hydroxylating ferredoxin subunit
MARIHLGPLLDLPSDGARIVPVPHGAPPRLSLLVVRAGAEVRAFWNVCRHLPVPLDSGAGALPPDPDLICLTHGARYRRTDGLCVAGPCKGARLEGVEVEEVEGEWFVEV